MREFGVELLQAVLFLVGVAEKASMAVLHLLEAVCEARVEAGVWLAGLVGHVPEGVRDELIQLGESVSW